MGDSSLLEWRRLISACLVLVMLAFLAPRRLSLGGGDRKIAGLVMLPLRLEDDETAAVADIDAAKSCGGEQAIHSQTLEPGRHHVSFDIEGDMSHVDLGGISSA